MGDKEAEKQPKTKERKSQKERHKRKQKEKQKGKKGKQTNTHATSHPADDWGAEAAPKRAPGSREPKALLV